MLFLYRNNRMESLLGELVRVLAQPKRSALKPEVIVVQSLGMERWLSMGLANELGIWANATYPFPRAFIESLAEAVIGPQSEGERYTKNILTLRLAKVLSELPREPTFAPLHDYLTQRPGIAPRLELAQQLAEVFDQVQVYRPDWLLAWAGTSAEAHRAEAPRNEFMPALYRLLASKMGAQHTPARIRELARRLQQPDLDLGCLPERISLFGVASLPPMFIQIFDALSQRVAVHWYLLTASREYIGEERIGRRALAHRESEPGLDWQNQQPLLRSNGRIMRDMAWLLERDCPYVEAAQLDFTEPEPRSVLATLQADLCALRRRAKDADPPPVALSEQDRSIEIHACHGPRRELEVLRELLLEAFEQDASLRPEDVIVLLRDVETYAPLVESVFSAEANRPGYIPYTLSERTVGAGNPLAEAMLQLLELSATRMTVLDLCQLLERPPIQERFGIVPAQIPKIREWMRQLHVTWGVDLSDRLREGAVGQPENTLRFGLSRLLLGVACARTAPSSWNGLLPIAVDLEGDDAELAGRIAECSETLFDWRGRFCESRSLADWHRIIAEAARALLFVDAKVAWQLAEFLAVTAQLKADAHAAEFDEPVPARVIVDSVRRHYEQTRSSQTLLSTGVTFCRMLPMRGIPARLVAMVGLDDGCFPRSEASSSFDEVARAPSRAGDRSVRDEDRHLFLETILAARERLIITYCGRNPRDDSVLPRSVVVEELLSVLDESFHCSSAKPSERLVVWHPLHAHDARYFDRRDPRLSVRSPGEFEAALAQRGAHRSLEPGMTGALHGNEAKQYDVETLERFWGAPAEYFYRVTLGASLERDRPALAPLDPTELDALERYLLTTDQLGILLGESPALHALERWTADGKRPFANLGKAIFDEQLVLAESMRGVLRGLTGGHPPKRTTTLVSKDDVTVFGVVLQRFPIGIVDFGLARVTARHRLNLWLRHLLLNASGLRVASWLVRRHKQEATRISIEKLATMAADEASAHLFELVRLLRLGERAPLAFFPQLSFDYALRLQTGEEPSAAIERAKRDYGDPLTDDDEAFGRRPLGPREVLRLFGSGAPLDSGWSGRFGIADFPDFAQLSSAVFTPYLRLAEAIEPEEVSSAAGQGEVGRMPTGRTP